MKILSNTTWFANRRVGGEPVDSIRIGSSPAGLLKAAWQSLSVDVIVVNVEHRELLLFCLIRRLLRRRRQLIVAVDQILEPASDKPSRLRLAVIRSLLREVRHFVFYYPDTEDVARLYGIPKERISYVPFKVNGLSSVRAQVTSDDGYVLACGRSRRDYVAFCAAVADLPVQAIILAPIGAETREHGTVDELRTIPANVRIVHDNGSWESWLKWLAGATLVVIPILPPTLAPSGIGTYLVAMALGKCVVITDSPASRGILNSDQAVIVPPRDVDALRSGIQRVLDDQALRQRIASAGQAYAFSLGDEGRLANDIFALIVRLVVAD